MINSSVSLNGDYATQLADLQRRQKMAELLQQQSIEPIQTSSYEGIQAPISPLSGLAKILEAYTAAKAMKDVTTKTSALQKAQRDDFVKQMTAPATSDATPPPAPPAGPSPSDIASAPPVQVPTPQMPSQGNPMAAALSQGAPPPQQSSNPLIQALASRGTPQDIANAPPVQPPPPQAAPSMGMNGPLQAPQMSLTPPTMQPAALPPTPPQGPHQMSPQEQYQRALLMMGSGNPYVANAAPELMKQAQEQIKKQADLADASAQKQADRQTDIATATGLVKSLPGLTEDQRGYLAAVAQSGGMTALKPSLDKLSEVKFAPQVTTASPDDLKGYPAGTIGQKDANGKLVNVYNPSEDQNRAAQLKISQQNERLHAQEVGIQAANSARDSLVQPVSIEYQVNGEPVQTTASFDKKTGNYIDLSNHQPIINPQGLRLLPTASGSSRSAMGIARTLTSAHDAVTGIENLSNIDNRANVGMFPNLATTPKSALTRVMSPQEVQSTQATMGGLGRAMAGLASGGLAPDQNTLHSYEALTPALGDTQLTKMRKLAEMRQQTENALEVQGVSPLLTPDQKKQVDSLKARVAKAIPWTVADVQTLENAKDPNVSLRSLGVGAVAAGKAAPAGVDARTWSHMTPQEQALWH